MYQGSRSLKFYKRLGIYKNSSNTVSYNPVTNEGRSYNWQFCSKKFGKVIFNTYNWSPTTSRHQTAVMSCIRDYVDAIYLDLGTQEPRYIDKNATIKVFKDMIEAQIAVETTKRKDAWTYKSRVSRYETLKKNLETLENLDRSLRLTKKEKNDLIDKVFEDSVNKLSQHLADKTHKFLSLQDATTNFEAIEI